MGAMFVDDLDLYTWRDSITDPTKLVLQAQREVTQWSLLLNATRGALKPEKCFWCLLDYTCNEGMWSYAVHSDFEIFVNSLTAIGGPDRQLFFELRARVVSPRIFVRSQSLIAR